MTLPAGEGFGADRDQLDLNARVEDIRIYTNAFGYSERDRI